MSTKHNTFDASIQSAARQLESGQLVAFPTETVYGLGADAENPSAVAAIYAAKGRPANHPVIVHLAPEADIQYWAADIPAEAHRLIAAFWPGPLTLILTRAAHIPGAVSGGQDSIGLRCPSHPVAQQLLRAFKNGKGGIAAPSANKFGHVSPTTAQHVRDEFPAELANQMITAVLDGGQSDVGIESTILDLTRLETHGPVLLRPGHISAAELARVLGIQPSAPDITAPRASGTLDAHYAPNTPVVLIAEDTLESTIQQLLDSGKKVAVMRYQEHVQQNVQALKVIVADPSVYAHDLYAGLRELDAAHADVILVEMLPDDHAWQGVNDRLRRAAFDSRDVLQKLLTN
ncbi:L-threonylcarbamoyladenylate synthase [Undibacterium sp. RTI2.1]|uniref:L-threonylcarbamoyladenylate synthase n=1 Tax=unclassified Undibacterium TaxID=2630295 RepID=UPI002AB46689|nr:MULTISPECIES: L-threonylcarbamoyladenylate synthase [unclassified Undibacterium]MDY7539054.1 L-threonylcarbamoyladenylate synthase [Undibacterium sp. 5I1]MEB0031021.1 L-threonylcarbamoyladenylate synthase [Undibacterium sp. RTI2.1]MEB0115868.1 L-threonylcarbamoyladenylate synthase [Undibacterium sp. RTI2.2]MEB0229812.1 L-threonylcarbamoyladenylate synthase [Undibacterium sp. 10I3]